MIEDLKLKIGPQYYHFAPGAIDDIGDLLEDRNAKRVLILHGQISWEKASPFFENVLKDERFEFILEKYNGECSYSEGRRVAKIIEENNIDFLIGVGGGKIADLALYTSSVAKVPFGTVATMASNCAHWTALSVMYKDNGLLEGKSEHQTYNSDFFVTDPNLIITTPKRLFIAGLADTIVKWYESDLVTKQEKVYSSPMVRLARNAALICKDDILNNYQQAMDDLENNKVTEVFYNLSEIIFGVAGLVGGIGGKYARNTAAHTVHDAISACLPQVHSYLHGEKVAYGMLYQLALEDKWSEIDNLTDFYKKLDLPRSMKDMGVENLSDDQLNEIVKFMDGKEKIHLLPMPINQELLKKTFIKLENYINL